MKLTDFVIGIFEVSITLLFIYLVFNGVSLLTCRSMEGNPYWNKVVVACHFNDTSYTVSQTIITQDSQCFKNGVKINCSELSEVEGR